MRLLITFFVSYDVTVTSLKKVLVVPTFVAADDTVYHVFLRVVIAMEWSAKIVTMNEVSSDEESVGSDQDADGNIFDDIFDN